MLIVLLILSMFRWCACLVAEGYNYFYITNYYACFTKCTLLCYLLTACELGAIRVNNGGSMLKGNVEVCYYNVWGTVCGNGWNITAAQVVCRQLGFPTTGALALTLGDVPAGRGMIWLDKVSCIGTEVALEQCNSSEPGVHKSYCVHSQDAGVICLSKLKVSC